MKNDLDKELWRAQEAAFDDYKSDQGMQKSQDEDTQSYYQLYQLLDNVAADKSQPNERLVSAVSHKVKTLQRYKKVKALSAWMAIAVLSVAAVMTFLVVAKKSALFVGVINAAPWVLVVVTLAVTAVTAIAFNKILTRRH